METRLKNKMNKKRDELSYKLWYVIIMIQREITYV